MISSQQIGERIAEERKRRDITQIELAARLGVSRQTLIAMEKGERRPGADELVRVAAALGVSLHDLLKERVPSASVCARGDVGGAA